jgi:hypothetical protein
LNAMYALINGLTFHIFAFSYLLIYKSDNSRGSEYLKMSNYLRICLCRPFCAPTFPL